MFRSCQAHAVALVALAFVPLACKGAPPDQVRLELPDELVMSQDPVHAVVHVRRGGSSDVTNEKTDFTVTPGDVARVGTDNNLSCRKSGDAKVTAKIQGVSGSATVKCRLVDRLDAGSLPPFDVTKGAITVHAVALAKSGAPLDDVPVTMSTESPHVASVSGSVLTPLAVGETTLTLRAGSQTKTLPVRVVRSVTPEALPLEGGHRIYFGLPEGKYEVKVDLLVDRTVTVEWRGAPYCAYKGYGRSHVSTCVLETKGGAVVDNPAFLATGSTAVSAAGISISEVP
ncbi:MAG TPA: hypothetical protein VMI54_16430 [Polyangiaceae bacterium]|nr:hypothetical protein [Polyangiaceae bacterium]